MLYRGSLCLLLCCAIGAQASSEHVTKDTQKHSSHKQITESNSKEIGIPSGKNVGLYSLTAFGALVLYAGINSLDSESFNVRDFAITSFILTGASTWIGILCSIIDAEVMHNYDEYVYRAKPGKVQVINEEGKCLAMNPEDMQCEYIVRKQRDLPKIFQLFTLKNN